MHAAKNLRQNLRTYIERSGVSQREIAQRAGMSAVHLNRIVRGHAVPSLSMSADIARAIGCELAILVGHTKKFYDARLTPVKEEFNI